jgi:hypothetical protein
MVQLGMCLPHHLLFSKIMNTHAMRSTGTPGPGPTANLPIHEAVCFTKTYYGVSEGDSNPPEYLPKLIKLYQEGKFPLDKIAKVYDYTEMEQAIHDMHDGSVRTSNCSRQCDSPANIGLFRVAGYQAHHQV